MSVTAPITVPPARLANRDQLRASWTACRNENPQVRIRNAAIMLGVSELDLLLTGLGVNVVRLDDIVELLKSVQSLGEVMALSRNDLAVHEKTGQYRDLKVLDGQNMALCLGVIDLRMFLNHWQHAFAVTETGEHGRRDSLQFFDAEGSAVHKIYRTDATDTAAWTALVARHTHVRQELEFVATAPTPATYPNAGAISARAVRNEWQALRDVHDFNAMLKRLGVHRLEAIAKVGDEYARALPSSSAEAALQQAANRQVPIMVFVGNRGIVQIHTGTVAKLVRTGPWFNVLDADFNLHLNTSEITQAWSVKRPTDDGIVTSLEFYNAGDELVMTLFGERKPGKPELEAWRELVASLEAKA